MTNNHPMQRCNAKTRNGEPCKNPPVQGRKRCRMHGCAPGAGGQPGNQNALKHGYYSKKEKEQRSEIATLLDSLKDLTQNLRE